MSLRFPARVEAKKELMDTYLDKLNDLANERPEIEQRLLETREHIKGVFNAASDCEAQSLSNHLSALDLMAGDRPPSELRNVVLRFKNRITLDAISLLGSECKIEKRETEQEE